MTPRAIGHRGYPSVAPENTLAAIEAALRCGVGGIETDVQLTADGVPVIIHDTELGRTTDGAGAVAATTAQDLLRLDAGSWFSPAYAHQRVPLLDEVLAAIAAAPDVEVMLELKGTWGAAGVRTVAQAVAEYGLAERALLKSFSVATVQALGEGAAALRRGLLLDEWSGDVLALCRDLGVEACNPNGRILLERPEIIGQLHEAGLATTVWTLNEPAHWARATELGVDGIITDHPGRLLGWQDAQAA